jgi:hypothetical protein
MVASGEGDRREDAQRVSVGGHEMKPYRPPQEITNDHEPPKSESRSSAWARRVGLVLGILELTGAVLWCIAGAGIYGSPLVGMDSRELIKVWAFLFAGSLSVLPAAILACYWPRWGGLWLIGGGLLSGYLIVFSIPHPNLRGGLHFESVVPLLLVSMPMLVVGVWQMHTAGARSDG